MELIIEQKNNKELHKLVRFAVKAIAKKGCGHYLLTHICINKGKLCCTDGHRMHVVEHPQLKFYKTGMYELLENKKGTIKIKQYSDPIDSFPSFKMIADVVGKRREHAIKAQKGKSGFDIFVSQVIRAVNENEAISVNYLKDVYPFIDTFIPGEEKGCCLFESEYVKAYIMPINAV